MDAISVVRSYLASYAQLDYEKMACHTTDNFVFEDPAFPHLEGDFARGMFKMFIQGAPKSGLKITVKDVVPSTQDPANVVNAQYEAEYTCEGRHVTNQITSVLTVYEGKVSRQIDSFDLAAWAGRSRGFMGWLFGSTPVAQSVLLKKSRTRLEHFIAKDPELKAALRSRR